MTVSVWDDRLIDSHSETRRLIDMSECCSSQMGSGHSQEQAGSVPARDDDQGEHSFCFSQLLVTLVAESCISPSPPNTRAHTHSILGFTHLGCASAHMLKDLTRAADVLMIRGKCTLCEDPHYCPTCSKLDFTSSWDDPSNHSTTCQNTASAYYFR